MLDVLGQVEALGLRLGDQVGFKIGRQLDRDGHMGVPPLRSQNIVVRQNQAGIESLHFPTHL